MENNKGDPSPPRPSHLRWMRISVQLACLGAFITLLVLTAYPRLVTPPSNLMMRLDALGPLQYLFTNRTLAAMFWPALIILCLTMLSGRFFCGWICPLGTCFDLAGYLKPGSLKYYRPSGKTVSEMRNGQAGRKHRPRLRIKYLVLVVVLVTAILSVNILFLFDPFSIANRGIHFILALEFPFLFLALLLLAFAYWPRYWCQEICPLGALYSLFSAARMKLSGKWLALSVKKDVNSCIWCGACYRKCPFLIDEPFLSAESGPLRSIDCSLCGECVSACPAPGALSFNTFGMSLARSRGRETGAGGLAYPSLMTHQGMAHAVEPVMNRRDFIALSGIGAVAGAGYLLGAPDNTTRVLRPPGAQDEARFLATCTRCGECVRACPTGCIQLMTAESGFQKLWTPRMEPARGSCRFDIDDQVCQKVCPVNAIVETPVDRVEIGTARLNRNRCIAWRHRRLCLICMEQCRFQAISQDAQNRPVIDSEKCTGCGSCEYACIASPEIAIKVFPKGYSEEGFEGHRQGNRGRGSPVE